MATNTNTLWYIIIGALIILGITLGIRNITPDLLNNAFGTSKETIDIDDFNKNEIKQECLVFKNFKIEGTKIYADIENICYDTKSYNLTIDIYKDKTTIGKSVKNTFSINGNSIKTKINLADINGIDDIYTIKIKKTN